jgi:Zn-finger nucleic acid-binding protein
MKSLSPYAYFKTDAHMERNGVWLDLGPFRVLLARSGGANKEFSRLLQAKMKPYERQQKNKTVDERVVLEKSAEAYASKVFLQIQTRIEPEEGSNAEPTYRDGYFNADGEFVQDSYESRKQLLVDMEDLFHQVIEESSALANFRREELEQTEGNLDAS